jgi:metacaspase-1
MKKALLVGINEYPRQPLGGCLQDVMDMADYLTDVHGVSEPDIALLCDSRATKSAILSELNSLIESATAGDHLLFHYSGHGAQLPTRDCKELDGLDEVLCPVDFNWTLESSISDDELHEVVDAIGEGISLTCVFDSCCSGGLDRIGTRRPRRMNPPPDVAFAMRRRTRIIRSAIRASDDLRATRIAACAAYETAADTQFNGVPNGAFTYHLLTLLRHADGDKLSLQDLVAAVGIAVAEFHMHPSAFGPQPDLLEPFLGGIASAKSRSLGTQAEWQLAALRRGASSSADTPPAHRGVDTNNYRGDTSLTASWSGVELAIGHGSLSSLSPAVATVAAVLNLIGPVGGVPVLVMEALASYVVQSLPALKREDMGAGVYVRLNWVKSTYEVGPILPNGRSERDLQTERASGAL